MGINECDILDNIINIKAIIKNTAIFFFKSKIDFNNMLIVLLRKMAN